MCSVNPIIVAAIRIFVGLKPGMMCSITKLPGSQSLKLVRGRP